MSATIRAGDGDRFVEIAEEPFNADSFMIAARSSVETDAEKSTGFAEDAAEGAASIDNDEAAHANFQKDLLEQKPSEFVCVDVMDGDAHHELSEVAHGGKEVSSAGFSDGRSRAPKVAVEDEHRSGDGPAEEDFAVAANALIGENTMGALLDPVDNVLAATGPKETHANTEESFVNTEMTTDRAAMKNVEDETAQGERHDDEQERGARLEALANDKTAMMNAEIVVVSKLTEGWMQGGNNSGAPREAGGEMTEKGSSVGVRGIGRGPGSWRWKRVGGSG
jgi:hypothetical protein